MFGFFNLKSFFKSRRQVYFLALFTVFMGFIAGAVYSNMISDENFATYTEITEKGINAAKNGEWTKELMPDMHSDTANLISIFVWSFFLFGKPFSGFFSFKSGFSAGFFISFFIKAYKMQGFSAGMYLLLNKLMFVFPATILLTAGGFSINSCITESVFEKNSGHMKGNIKKQFFPYFLIFILSYIMTTLGNYINFAVMPIIIKSIF